MWTRNSDTGKWIKQKDELNKEFYDGVKQDLQLTKLYSKCLSGSTYIPINSFTNSYAILDTENKGYRISDPNSEVFPQILEDITKSNSDLYYKKLLREDLFTIKNLFTPDKLISRELENIVQVDIATTSPINLSLVSANFILDGIRVLSGHKILVKNQLGRINLSTSTPADIYFRDTLRVATYSVIEQIGTQITYEYPSSENGIYEFNGSTLVKTLNLSTYDSSYKLVVYCKLGTNKDKEFHISRLLNNLYPIDGEGILFEEKQMWILRNRVDYNNIYDINYYDVISHTTQSFYDSGVTYSIPSRKIAIGEFGIILNNQDSINGATFGNSTIITNKWRRNLKSIIETTKNYWICGDEGLLLKSSKVDFKITSMDLDEVSNFESISFFGDLYGVSVGKFNTIWYTRDGGVNWKKLEYTEFDKFSYNKVLMIDENIFYVVGESGVFIEFQNNSGNWIAYKRTITKFLNNSDEFILQDDINDVKKIPYLSSYFILLSTDNNHLIAYDINKVINTQYDFVWLDFTTDHKDINSVSYWDNYIYFAADKIYKTPISGVTFSNNTFNEIGVTSSLVHDLFANKILTNNDMLVVGNNSLLKVSDYSTTTEWDYNFFDKYKSKMLFLDYDIASKLNFFDDSGEYRLPDSVTFSVSSISQSYINFDHLTGELNWNDYYKDSIKTFKYLTDFNQNNVVYYSSSFTFSSVNSYVINSGASSQDGIESLIPSLTDSKKSEFILGSFSIPNNFTTPYNLLLKKNFLVIRARLNSSNGWSDSTEVGDVLYMDSDFVETNFMVNKILYYKNVYPGNPNGDYVLDDFSGEKVGLNQYDKYIICYTDFNSSIVRSFTSYTKPITIKNLNKYSGVDDLVDKISKHPIGIGYELINNSGVVEVKARFNNKTSYYNLQTKVNGGGQELEMKYKESFLNFGYSPTYNLLDYLNNINPVFSGSKGFAMLPKWRNLTGNNGSNFTTQNIYIDPALGTNKLVFGEDYKFVWESLFINTFVDINFNSVSNTKCLITKKYLVENYDDQGINGYVVEFYKKFDISTSIQVSQFDILSRNTLSEISSDLQILNNIQRSETQKTLLSYTFTNLENDLKTKFYTDSYFKVLVSDVDIQKSLSAIIYTDSNYQIAMNLVNFEKELVFDIVSTNQYNNKLWLQLSTENEMKIGDGIILQFNGGTGSSQELNQNYFGYHTISDILNSTNIVIDIPFGNYPIVQDRGKITWVKRDPFFNYQPIDLFKMGSDSKTNVSIEINPYNYEISNSLNLVNLDLTKFKIRFLDGLSLEEVSKNFSWFLEAEVSNAIIGRNDSGLVWYNGIWRCGRWFGGTWLSGRWVTGDWYAGVWNSFSVNIGIISASINNYQDEKSSRWLGGRWFEGTWSGGSWFNGRFYGGTWKGGVWYNGIWNDGTWMDGIFQGGVWVLGKWFSGLLNSDAKPSYWLDGEFISGDFENGTWYNGKFGDKTTISRFGTKSTNSRPSTWHGGRWISGDFHSRLNVDDTGQPIVSDIHKYSIWRTGLWLDGNFWGGIAYNIDFRGGKWKGGILEEIQVIGLDPILPAQTSNNRIQLNGVFKFNIGDEFWMLNDGILGTFSVLGSNESPMKYRINRVIEATQSTYIDLNYNLSTLGVPTQSASVTYSNVNLGLKVVSSFKNSDFESGIWTNGYYESGNFLGGIWYNGVFKGTWGV